MAFSIGRAGLNPATLGKPNSLSIDGNRVRLGGYCRVEGSATVETQRILVEQLRGLNDNPDEPVIPVVWTEEPQVEAFYAVDSVTVDCDPDFWANGHFRWTASLTRITDGALPLIENTYALNGRGNDHSVTLASSTPWISRHGAVSHYYKGSTASGVGAGTVDNDIERPTNGIVIDTTLSTTAGIYTAQWSIVPSRWYTDAASVEVSYDSGSSYYPVVGRQIRYGYVPGSGGAGALVRVNTGRVMWNPSLPADGTYTVTTSSGESATDLTCILSGAAPGTTAQLTGGMSILRNAPHIAAARFYTGIYNHFPTRPAGYIDVAGRRGSHYLECHWADKETWIGGVCTSDGGGHTAITAGTRRTSNDANGNRIVILTTKTKTNDLTSGGFTLTTPLNSLPFAVGFEVDGSGAQNGDKANDLIYQYFGAVTENVRLVTR
jgi:hypothetical protein